MKKYYTKQEIKQVIKLWDEYTIEEIANKLDRTKVSILYIASHIRKCGFKLSRKLRKGTLDGLIKEVLTEL